MVAPLWGAEGRGGLHNGRNTPLNPLSRGDFYKYHQLTFSFNHSDDHLIIFWDNLLASWEVKDVTSNMFADE